MKNKRTGYFLVPVVLAIWGMIGWKIYAAVRGTDKNVVPVSVEPGIKSVAEIPDTIQLIANYRDPFLGKASINNENSEFSPDSYRDQESKLPSAKIPDPPKIVWPKISYHGLVKRSGTERALGFLNVNGATYFVKGGEEVAELKVGKMWRDSVEIIYGREKRVFTK